MICRNGSSICEGCGSSLEAEPVLVCAECGDNIFAGEKYYEIDGENYCETCIEHLAREAS